MKVFGTHDEKTIQQLWTCMAVGDVKGGVLCADGHYGYAHPVVGGDLDEAPLAYRRLPDVLQAHEGTIRVLHTLSPFLVHMAAPEIRDPYRIRTEV